MLTGSDGTTYEPLHFTFFFALSCKATLARCHRHLLVSKAPKPSSIKIGVGAWMLACIKWPAKELGDALTSNRSSAS